jgi:hypothetical protein
MMASLRTENRLLREHIAAMQRAIVIRPGEQYVIEYPEALALEEAEFISELWREATGVRPILLTAGLHLERMRRDGSV